MFEALYFRFKNYKLQFVFMNWTLKQFLKTISSTGYVLETI